MRPTRRRAVTVTSLLLCAAVLTACWPFPIVGGCPAYTPPHPAAPAAIAGAWAGTASSSEHGDEALAFELEVAYVDPGRYDVAGTLTLGTGPSYDVLGTIEAGCGTRFDEPTSISGASVPLPTRLEAILWLGADSHGSLGAYPSPDRPDELTGYLGVGRDAWDRVSYTYQVTRP